MPIGGQDCLPIDRSRPRIRAPHHKRHKYDPTQKKHRQFINEERFTNATGSPVADNTNSLTAGPRGPLLLQDIWLLEKLAHFDREVIPEGRMHTKG
jgi:catalase